ncbi:MAG: NADP-dependent oxidoreductase [Betaproteobacteria bacterium]|nr:NADP-dependent oxidoreductase [Betaproteobacteria bacterium]
MQVLLAARPSGRVEESHFRIVESDTPRAGEGEFVVRAHYLSLDPYMRGRMDDSRSYAAKAAVGDVMVGTAVGEVIESRHLGAVGMPGVTAWIGLNEHGRPKAGETVVVSAAGGAVGSAVGQLAKLQGCRAVGIAGGRAKCDYVANELGFDACIDYKAGNLDADLAAACPKGIDVYFDNVGGPVLDAVLLHMNAFSRIALCGQISGYSDPDALTVRNFRCFLINRIQLRGFICSDHLDLWKGALKELGTLVHEGRLKYRESIAIGLENAPRAFIGLLNGQNFGKQLVKLI